LSPGVRRAAGVWGDISADWREELILVANDYSEIRIYTTTLVATNRLYCLMQDPAYRGQATLKGYTRLLPGLLPRRRHGATRAAAHVGRDAGLAREMALANVLGCWARRSIGPPIGLVTNLTASVFPSRRHRPVRYYRLEQPAGDH